MILVIGGGVAGLTAATAAHAAGAEVTLVTAGTLVLGDACSTAMAQGGVAAAVARGDRAADHLLDTLAAGAGLVDAEAARVLVGEGATDVQRLVAAGFAADRGPAGELSLGLEAAHGARRIVHAGGDRTGAVLHAHLVAQLPAGVRVIERATCERLLVDAGAVVGASLTGESGLTRTVHARAVVLATGGYAALYGRTSNHAGARGEGIVAAAEAGAIVADLEFVQFHPTVLAGTGQLISEAVRGAGAVLRDGAGERFMVGMHPAADLASRDIVSREIHRVLRDRGEAAVWLDATGIERAHGAGSLARMFPSIDLAIRAHGLDWATAPVPVAPAAHYTMGGVATDLDGRSSMPGLFVAGEAAATGVHGANRLASNSLLEGLVFGRRAGSAAAAHSSVGAWRFAGAAMMRLLRDARPQPSTYAPPREPMVFEAAPATRVGQILDERLGIERTAGDMTGALAQLGHVEGREARLAELIAHAALERTESRGAHQRLDYQEASSGQAQRRAFAYHCAPDARTDDRTDAQTLDRRSPVPC